MKSLGIDVGVRKGLDLVLLSGGAQVLEYRRHVEAAGLPSYIDRWSPSVIAIDSPPCFPRAGRRATEVDLSRRRLSLFWTPSDPAKQKKRFYDWMRVGFEVYQAARKCGFDLFEGGLSVEHSSIEVFPFATAAVLSRSSRPSGVSKSIWRRGVLERVGVGTGPLGGVDQIDAALAAYTGLQALKGQFCYRGVPAEGVILLPCPLEALLLSYARRPTGPTA